MAVDIIARMMAMWKGGGTSDAYTKAETDQLLDGKADLVDGKVPASELPSYVDDTVEGYYYQGAFYEDSEHTITITGETGKIYIDLTTNKSYRWTGTVYVRIDECPAFGETQGTIYEGNKGKQNADAIAAIKDGTNIDSFADVETALADKADKSTTYTKGQVDTALATKLNKSDVDASLNSTSTNPVQNKAVYKEIASLWLSQKSTRGGVYGAYWDGGESPILTRTDDAATLSDPNPYYNGNASYGSPFDTIMPWAGIERCRIGGNEFVKIPKFWFKVTKSGDSMKYQIANSYQPGFYVSPAHADRGDGVGERDYVYVGRYHCASDYKSKTGVTPITDITRAAARTGCHALGDNYWQFDFAMFWTTRLLYIVEMANFDSQAVIGYGRGNVSSAVAMGYTDAMPYHTGTMAADRTTYGANTQYRYMEGLWDNVQDWCDGIVFSNTSVYVHNTPSEYNDSITNYTLVGTRSNSDGCIRAVFVPTEKGYEYAMYPSYAHTNNYDTYFTDFAGFNPTGVTCRCGGNWDNDRGSGIFFIRGTDAISDAYQSTGARLQYLPG